ncbi:MAG TPA: beta-propeller fold lactonase family protein [Solirubrobacteraceae bacterium]|nr:beta-propeller fold lactonase family protein [Solirubrobacteraceae bacterium]
MRTRRVALGVLGALALAGVARADLPSGGGPTSVVSNFGRLIAPRGDLTQLGYFPTGAALTPDGRFAWTVDAGRRSNGVQIVDAHTGHIVQQFITQDVGTQGGVIISHDGRRAYVSEPQAGGGHSDQIAVYRVDPASGRATPDGTIAVTAPQGTQPVDDFPPNPGEFKSYPAGLALTTDDRTLVAALYLSERVAVIDTASRAVTQVQVRSDTKAGDRAYPLAVTVAGGHAYVADEGDGTVASFALSSPGSVTRVTPAYVDPSGLNPKRTHPSAIVASPDGSKLYVALTGSDQVLELDAADPSQVLRRIDARRGADVGTQPVGLALSPDGQTLFVANTFEDVVRAIALSSRRVTLPPGGHLPGAIDAGARPGGASTPPYGTDFRHGAPNGNGGSCARGKGRRSRTRDQIEHRRPTGRPATAGASAKPRRGVRRPGARRRSSSRVCTRKRSGHRHRARRRRPLHRAARAPAPADSILVRPGDELARIPAGIYPREVLVAPDGGQLLIVDSKGVGPGSTLAAGESVSVHVLGMLQRLTLPRAQPARDTELVRLGAGGDEVPVPADHQPAAPVGSPLTGPGGVGPSQKIKYVFYVVTENKTYDSVLGDLGRGNGDPCLAIFGEFRHYPTQASGAPCPQGGFGTQNTERNALNPGQRNDGTPVTPNEHELAREFVTLDNTYSNSETSDDGHIWTSSAYAPEHDLRATFANNGPGGYPFDLLYPVSAPPKGFFFDSLVRQGVSFFNYGEAAAGLAFPDPQATSDELATHSRVLANSEYVTQYPSSAAIDKDPITMRYTYDHDPGTVLNPTQWVSRMQYFRKRFGAQIAACAVPSNPQQCAVPQYQELLFPNNHTAGTIPGRRTPDALIRDTDVAIGQLVSDISHSKIWPYSAIFVVQDDAQSGADHVEGHRITALVASPYARRGAVVSTHYDTVSVIRTIELILGIEPTYLYDALARPMWEAFQPGADTTPYALKPIDESLMSETNPPHAPMAATSSSISWLADTVPDHLLNQIQWAYRYGTAAACPARTGSIAPNQPCANARDELSSEQAKVPREILALRRAAAGGPGAPRGTPIRTVR